MKNLFTVSFIILFFLLIQACTNKCSEYGCLVVNDVKLSYDEAENLIDQCDRFTFRGLGRKALQYSYSEIAKQTGNNPNSPLMMAHLAYTDLYNSPLSFTRTKSAKDIDYSEILSSCNQLKRDFHGNRNWVH